MRILPKRRLVWVVLQDGEGHTLFDDRIERLALPEGVILSMCLEYYDDPAPCEIHRGAVVSRALGEIELHGMGCFAISGMPQRLQRYFSGYGAYSATVKVCEG